MGGRVGVGPLSLGVAVEHETVDVGRAAAVAHALLLLQEAVHVVAEWREMRGDWWGLRICQGRL